MIYTYMGVLRPKAGNANYATAGQLSPLFNDPYCLTIGLGTRIFLGGAQGYITWAGTQHTLSVPRGKNGVPLEPGATLMVMGDLKEMNPRWLVGVSILGYGCSLAVGIGVPIPILNEDIARYAGVSDEDIFTRIIDYGKDYPKGCPVCATFLLCKGSRDCRNPQRMDSKREILSWPTSASSQGYVNICSRSRVRGSLIQGSGVLHR
jgi:uncharacterized protein (DUF39 family)